MQSSPSEGALAAALAKAGASIGNPDESLTATIVSPFPRAGSRTFRCDTRPQFALQQSTGLLRQPSGQINQIVSDE
jgi:hypothetical protein